MKPHLLFGVIAFSIVLVACSEPKAVNKFADNELIKIHEYSYQLSTAQLLPYLQNANVNYRKEACLALASVQDTAAWKPLMDVLFNDENDEVRASAAYALGQFKVLTSLRPLIEAYERTTSSNVRAAILEAMGKLIQPNEIKWFSDRCADFNDRDETMLEGYGKCVLWMHVRGFFDDRIMKRIPFLLQYSQGTSRVVLSAAMARYRGEWFKNNTDYLISWLKTERTPDVKANILAMIGWAADADLHKTLVDYAQSNSLPVNVRFAAIKALRRSRALKSEDVMPLLNHPNAAIALAAADALEDAVDISSELNKLQEVATNDHPLVIARIACIPAKLSKPEEHWLLQNVNNAPSVYVAAAFAEGAGKIPACTEDLIQIALTDVRPAVRTSAAGALANILQNNQWPGNIPVFASLEKLIKSNETGIISSLLPAIETAQLGDSELTLLKGHLAAVLQTLSMPADIETYNMVVEVLQRLGQPLALKNNSSPYAIDWVKVTSIPADQKVVVHTNKGDIVLQLNVESSPAAVTYFMDQVKSSFYNGKFFHRVIPAFVAQGGCPRGDGMGSTTPLLRSEFYDHLYDPGAVGLASSGKDTESCQWFIALAPTYHLEGRYTIFARVYSGLEVAQSLVIGDIIESIEMK